jgi:hypothetical protein
MQWIIFGEFKFGCLLHFVEAFDKEKVVYEKIKTCELRDKWCVILCVYSISFGLFFSFLFNLVYRFVLILLEKTMLILELLLILGFMILSLLVFLKVFLLSSLLA